jgi:hypothetical protein
MHLRKFGHPHDADAEVNMAVRRYLVHVEQVFGIPLSDNAQKVDLCLPIDVINCVNVSSAGTPPVCLMLARIDSCIPINCATRLWATALTIPETLLTAGQQRTPPPKY